MRWFDRPAAVATLPDYLDLSNAGLVCEELLWVINRGTASLIADMTRTRTCDHAGSEALARVCKRAAVSGTGLLIAVESPLTQRTLTLNGLDRLVPMYASLEAALEAGDQAGPPAPDGAGTASAEGRRNAPVPDVGVEVAVLDRDGVIVSVNRAWQAFTILNGGDPARTGVGVSYLDACAADPGDPAAGQVAGAIRQALAGDLPAPVTIEVPCHSPAAYRWYDVLIAPNHDHHGRPAGATVTLSLVRSRPPAGRDQASASAGYTAELAMLQRLADTLWDGAVLVDETGTIRHASQRLADSFGYHPGQLTGHPIETLVPPAMHEAHRARLAAYARQPVTRPMSASAQVGLRNDGTTFPVQISLSPVSTTGRHLTLAVVRDITETQRRQRTALLDPVTLGGPAENTGQGEGEQKRADLIGQIISSLFRIGLSLQIASGQSQETASRSITEAIEEIDKAIYRIRETAFKQQARVTK